MREKMLVNLSLSEESHRTQIQKDLARSDKTIPFLFDPQIQQV